MTRIFLPYPPSANRYWRNFRGRMVRSKQATAYRQTVRDAGAALGLTGRDGPLSVRIWLHPRKTVTGRASKVCLDVDNCVKVVLDSLQGVAYVNDRQVRRLEVSIQDDDPRDGGALVVEVHPATERA